MLKKNFLPTEWEGNLDLALALTRHDKKRAGDGIDAVFVPSIGEYEIRNVSFDDFEMHVKKSLNQG